MLSLVQGLAKYEKQLEQCHVDAKTILEDAFGTHPEFYCLLVEDSKRMNSSFVCGLAFFFFGYSTWDGKFLHLEGLFVEEKYRGLGVGKQLMFTLADLAQNLSCSRFVWQALDWNKPALDFYKKIGAKTLHGWLTLRMEKDAMTKFLSTRSHVTSIESYEQITKKPLTRVQVCKSIDFCLEVSNLQLRSKENSSDLKLRRATENDVEAIMRLVNNLAIYEKEPESVHVNTDVYLQDGFGENPVFYCILLEIKLEDQSYVCGMGLFYFGYSTTDGRFLYLEDLFIEEKYRGLGAGKQIMYTLADLAKSLSCSRFVWQALDWNKPARIFYESIGAKTLHTVLTLRFEEDSIAKFLGTR